MRKNGFTLVELLVGLVIAALLMLTILVYFKQVSFLGLVSSEDAEYETQLEIGMLTVQKLVQEAGYGSGNADDIAEGAFDGNSAVFWRYVSNFDPLNAAPPAPSYTCRGFGSQISGTAPRITHRLVLLSANCNASANLSTAAWTVVQPVAAVMSTTATPVFDFSVVASSCVPFGIGEAVGEQMLIITGLKKYEYGSASRDKIRRVCLTNIKA
ncbi:MAG: prepilin-type N-terminal cleavage/methylation domain-containing protein [Venatoribacter sp.]